MPSKSIHLRQRPRATRAVDSTLRTHNRLLLQMEGNRNAVHRNAQVKRQNEGARLTKIESLCPAIHDCLPFLRKACGEVPDDLNSERESRQSRSTHGPSRNQLPALDLRNTGCITTLSYTCRPVSEWSDFGDCHWSPSRIGLNGCEVKRHG